MKIAVVSSTTIPATLPDDPFYYTTYGSEAYSAVLVEGLANKGHTISWYAPVKSSTFQDNPRIHYHPIVDSKGAHLRSELLEEISYDKPPAKTTDILDCDFLIDMSKQNHVSEDLSLYHGYKKYCHYKSGFRDWTAPFQIEPHFVTHCQYFCDNFIRNGYSADVCRFGIPDFWCPDVFGDGVVEIGDYVNVVNKNLKPFEYFLYPHRPNPEKGLNVLLKLARDFPQETFVISTAAVFLDHIAEMKRVKEECKDIPNIKFVDCPVNKQYHYYRRALMRNCKAVLSLFQEHEAGGYMDTGGLVSAEAVKCEAPVIVSRSPGSEELLGSLEDKGVTFVDSYESANMAIGGWLWETRPNPGPDFMSIKTYVEDYERVIAKYS